jgi:hypothetical protein
MPAALPPEAIHRLKTAIRDRLLPRFGGNQSAAARALDISAGTFSRLLSHGVGGSVQLVEAVAGYLNEDPGVILRGTDGATVRVRDMRGFQDAMAEAKSRRDASRQNVTDLELEEAADAVIIPELEVVTSDILLSLVLSGRRSKATRAQHREPHRRKAR